MRTIDSLLLLLAVRAEGTPNDIDWFGTLDAMGRGDMTALAKLRRLVTIQLARMNAYQVASDWDDFAQEVLLKVWRAHRDGKIREAPALPGFVRTTTRNTFIDWTRRHRREVDVEDNVLEEMGSGLVDEPRLDPGLELVLRKAIEGLSERHREVIESVYLVGRSYDETAAFLGRPRGTVNRQQREAMSQLREKLGAQVEGTADSNAGRGESS